MPRRSSIPGVDDSAVAVVADGDDEGVAVATAVSAACQNVAEAWDKPGRLFPSFPDCDDDGDGCDCCDDC